MSEWHPFKTGKMERINKQLSAIESRYKIKILYACETGSRAWGFPSPDSDFDVRFIYMHERDWYLSLSRKKDSIEHMDGDFDITGWDLRKSLLLLKKANAPLIERFRSPVIYYAQPGFAEDFLALVKEYYSPTAVFFHHYSLAAKFWSVLNGQQEVKLKSFFYLVRSLLSCYWITQDSALLPMNIYDLMNKIDIGMRKQLEELIQLKAGVGEQYLHPVEEWMPDWINQMWETLNSSKENLGTCNRGFDELNRFFLATINRYVND